MSQATELTVVARWEVAAEQAALVRDLLLEMRRHSLAEPGCRAYEVHEVEGAAGQFVIVERYDSPEANEEHRRAPYFQDLVLGRAVPLLTRREVVRCRRLGG